MNPATKLALFAMGLVATFLIAFFAAQTITSHIDGWDPVVTETHVDQNGH